MAEGLSPQLEQQIPEGASCEKHLAPLLLFCDDDQIMVCDKCCQSEEHKNHRVYGVEEAAENYKVSFETPEHSGCLLFINSFLGGTDNLIVSTFPYLSKSTIFKPTSRLRKLNGGY